MNTLIYGAGENGRVVLDILRSSNTEVVGFIDDNQKMRGKKIDVVEVLGTMSDLERINKSFGIVIAIGDNKKRVEISNKIENLGFKLVNAIHPSSVISKSAVIRQGVVIAAGVVINPNAELGKNVIINTGSTIDHDCVIEEGVHIAPGVHLAGGVKIKKNAFLGIGSVVIDDLTIGENSIVGAGTVVIEDVPPNVTVVGVPGKIIKGGKNR